MYFLTFYFYYFYFNINFDYKTIETEHFTIKYLPKAESKARLVAFYAESIYEPVAGIFKMKSPRKTMMVLKEYTSLF